MVCADLTEGTFKENNEIAREVAARHPYGDWIKDESTRLAELGGGHYYKEPSMSAADALKLQVGRWCTLSQSHLSDQPGHTTDADCEAAIVTVQSCSLLI